MKTQLVVWLSGFVAGLVVMESLRRLGDRSDPMAQGAGDLVAAGGTPPASADKPKRLKSIIAGATSEADRARHMVSHMMPWVKDSTASLADTAPTSRTRSASSFEGDEGGP